MPSHVFSKHLVPGLKQLTPPHPLVQVAFLHLWDEYCRCHSRTAQGSDRYPVQVLPPPNVMQARSLWYTQECTQTWSTSTFCGAHSLAFRSLPSASRKRTSSDGIAYGWTPVMLLLYRPGVISLAIELGLAIAHNLVGLRVFSTLADNFEFPKRAPERVVGVG